MNLCFKIKFNPFYLDDISYYDLGVIESRAVDIKYMPTVGEVVGFMKDAFLYSKQNKILHKYTYRVESVELSRHEILWNDPTAIDFIVWCIPVNEEVIYDEFLRYEKNNIIEKGSLSGRA